MWNEWAHGTSGGEGFARDRLFDDFNDCVPTDLGAGLSQVLG
jgi:hypothetical protein